ncbi:MAG TPA: glutathione S-transferase family protein [Polyangiaceae bacterium]|nr:glutathione S-transferase family protein [Polyangiaceae bacterium]
MKAPRFVLCELADANLPRVETYSPMCLKVHRALQLCGFSYERRHAARPDQYGHYNPAKQVPVLLVGGEAVFDSTRALSRLDLLSGGALSRGLDSSQKGEAFLWEEMADTVLYGFVVAARWADEANWPLTKAAYFAGMPSVVRAIVPARIRNKIVRGLWARDVTRPSLAICWARFEETLDNLEASAPKRGFWLGEVPTRADVAIFAQMWSLRTALTPRQGASVDARPALSAWLSRVDEACLAAAAPSMRRFTLVRDQRVA